MQAHLAPSTWHCIAEGKAAPFSITLPPTPHAEDSELLVPLCFSVLCTPVAFCRGEEGGGPVCSQQYNDKGGGGGGVRTQRCSIEGGPGVVSRSQTARVWLRETRPGGSS